jgi:hypothetical protein
VGNITTLASKAGSALTPLEADANLVELDRRTSQGWRDYPFAIVTPDGSLYPPVWQLFEDDVLLPAFNHGFRTDGVGTVHLDHDYVLSEVFPHIHWTLNSNASGVVRWLIKWKFARRADAPARTRRFTAAQTIVLETNVAANSAGLHMVSEPPDGSGIYHPDLDVDSIIILQITRDGEHANDTFPGSAFVLCGDAHAEVDKIGTPLRTPPFYP